MDNVNTLNVMTTDELLKHLQQTDPNFIASNVVRIKPVLSLDSVKPLTITEIMAMSPPKVEHIVYPILPTQGICWIYAATGLGKTLFTLNLAYAIAQGGSFLKYTCSKPRKVLYIDGEMSFYDLHSRMLSISKHHGLLDFPDNLSFITPDKVLPAVVPKMDEKEGQQYYEDLINKEGYDVIVFDNISVLTSFDENKSEEWKPVQNWLLYLRSIGKAIFVIHHAGKDKQGYRGSSKMLDTANTAISLQPIIDDIGDEDTPHVKKFNVVYHKHRSFGGREAQPYEVILDKDIWSYRSMEQTNIDRVVEKVKAGMSQREIAREMIISQTSVRRLSDKARKLNLL